MNYLKKKQFLNLSKENLKSNKVLLISKDRRMILNILRSILLILFYLCTPPLFSISATSLIRHPAKRKRACPPLSKLLICST